MGRESCWGKHSLNRRGSQPMVSTPIVVCSNFTGCKRSNDDTMCFNLAWFKKNVPHVRILNIKAWYTKLSKNTKLLTAAKRLGTPAVRHWLFLLYFKAQPTKLHVFFMVCWNLNSFAGEKFLWNHCAMTSSCLWWNVKPHFVLPSLKMYP